MKMFVFAVMFVLIFELFGSLLLLSVLLLILFVDVSDNKTYRIKSTSGRSIAGALLWEK